MKTCISPAPEGVCCTPSRQLVALVIALACLALLPVSSHAIVDLDTDTLDDVWEEFFNAQTVAAGDDEDGDGNSNLEECIAGTDPFDPTDAISIGFQSTLVTDASITFPTVNGKVYQVQLSTSPEHGSFANHGSPIHGTGAHVTVDFSAAGDDSVTGSATHEVWTGISGSSVIDLTDNPNFPGTPGGTEALANLQTSSNVDDNFGGRISGFIKPPATGDYTFYIASSHGSEFWLSSDDSPANKALQAGVGSNGVPPGQWTESSSLVSLTAGQKYYFEVLHQHGTADDHCAVAWEGPGLPTGVHVVEGDFLCPIAPTASGPAPIGGARHFVRICVEDIDQDGDGLSDYAEKLMAGDRGFSPFDSSSAISGSNDLATVTNALGATSEIIDIVAPDPEAIEDNRDGAQVTAGTPIAGAAPNPGRFQLQRSGSLQPLTISLNLAGAPLDVDVDAAEANDYVATDDTGSPVAGSVSLGFGQLAAQVVIHPVDDSTGAAPYEFPETVRCTVSDTASYNLGSQTFADVVIYDARNIPEQEILLVASSEPEQGAVGPRGSAVVAGKMNGHRNHMTLNTVINSGFSSPQNDSHIHKANAGPSKGSIVYEITNIPGVPLSDPLLGEIGPDYPYPIERAAGFEACQMIDSLFNQKGETPLYLNWHTDNNNGGELWAFFSVANGSIDPPVHPPMPSHTLLSGDDLEREIFRFLNQATFGATDAEVQDIKAAIETERLSNPTYSRIEEFDKWIDAQIALDQTYIMDYYLAIMNQEWYLRDYFNPADWHDMAYFPDNPSLPPTDPGQSFTLAPIPPISPSTEPDGIPLGMPLPAAWPAVDRSPGTTGGNPLQWRFTADYPLSMTRRAWGENNNNQVTPPQQRWNGSNYVNNSYDWWAKRDFGIENDRNRFLVHWMMHVNAHDQLRQKMGFALQQICVVANTLTVIQDRPLGMVNYQDQLNRLAFSTYRDVIEWIMWSPQMGHWLTSLQNQKEADISVPPDGIIDVFPDENLAREVMQLFTCGLFILHPDGSLALDSENGLPQASYDNDDITELSRVITGQSYGKYATGNNSTEYLQFDTPTENNSFTRGAGDSRTDHTFLYPMKMFGEFHDTGAKTILGGKQIDNTGLLPNESAVGVADLKDALDWLAGIPGDGQPDFDQASSHQSTAPFIARRLIQRFVTSNPSPAYVERVSKAFADGEGDLLAACKAILLDYEARDPAAATHTFGLKKSPYEAYVHLLRAFDAHSQTPLKPYDGSEPASYTGNGDYNVGSNPYLYLETYGYPASQSDNFRLNTQYRYNETGASQLSMSPMNQDTVFNFYLPDYSPGGVIASASLVAPEMMLADETSIYRNINYFYTMCLSTSTSGEQELDLINANDAFMVTSGSASNNERIRIDTSEIANAIYPPTGTEHDRDTALFDEMDRRLTGGLFKQKYPWNPADDEDPLTDGTNPASPTYMDGDFNNDKELMNPREAIISFMTDSYGTSSTNIRDKFRYGLYLLTTSPDYLVRQ